MEKSTQDVIKQLEDPASIIRKTEDIDPLAMIKKSLFIGENMATFTSAASYKVYRRSQIDLGIATKKRGRSKYRYVVHIEIVYFIRLYSYQIELVHFIFSLFNNDCRNEQ